MIATNKKSRGNSLYLPSDLVDSCKSDKQVAQEKVPVEGDDLGAISCPNKTGRGKRCGLRQRDLSKPLGYSLLFNHEKKDKKHP